jgi:hypothetical protein
VLASTVGAGHLLEVRIAGSRGCLVVAGVHSADLAKMRSLGHLEAVHSVGQEAVLDNRNVAGKDYGCEAEHYQDWDVAPDPSCGCFVVAHSSSYTLSFSQISMLYVM